MNNSQKQPLLTPIMRWFLFAMVLANIGSNMFQILLPIYLTQLGADVEQVGIVFTITSLVMLILQIFGGWVSDSIGRLRAIAIGSVGGIIGYVAILLAPTWQWMLVALAILRIPYALVGPSFGAFIAENSTEENRGRVYGLTDTIFQITGVLGPPLGGFLAGAYGFKIMLLVSAILYSLAAVLRIWMSISMRSPEEKESQALTTSSLKSSVRSVFALILGGGVITWMFLTDGVTDFAFRLSFELQPLYLEQVGGLSIEQIGILGSIFSIAMMFTPILSGKISDKYGERVPISMGFFLIFIALMIFINVQVFVGFAVTWIIFGCGVGLLSPAYSSLMSKVVPQNLLGIFTGLFGSSIGFISLPAPYIGAMLWTRYTPRMPYTITAAAAILTIIPIWFKFKVPDKGEPDGSTTTE